MFKKMKNFSNMSCILLLVSVIIFCSIYASRNKLYTEGLTGSTSTGLKDYIYHSGAPHALPTPLDWKETPQGLNCNLSNQPHVSGEADSFEACKKLFKKSYPTNIKTGIMSYFDLQENEKGKDYHNCGVSNISNCELKSSSWHSPSLGRNVTSRGYTLPNTIIKQPSSPPPPPSSPPPPPPTPAPPPPSGKCVPNVPALAALGNPIMDGIAGNGCKNFTTQASCGPIGPLCPQCCVWQPL